MPRTITLTLHLTEETVANLIEENNDLIRASDARAQHNLTWKEWAACIAESAIVGRYTAAAKRPASPPLSPSLPAAAAQK